MNYTEFADTKMTGYDGAYKVSGQSGNAAVAMAACNARSTCLAFSVYNRSGTYAKHYHLHDTNDINKLTSEPKMNTYIRDVAPKQREDIDNKIKEIYHAPGTITANFDENYRATMMMGTIVAMLGTAVLYLAVAL